MSQTTIHSDGSATLSINADAKPLDAALKKALASISGFIDSAADGLDAFDVKTGDAVRRFGKSLGGIEGALGKAKKALENAELPIPGTSGLGDATLSVDQSLFSEVVNSSALGALKSFGKSAVDAFVSFDDSIDKMSQRVGFSVETLSALSHAAGQCGTTLETVEGAIRGSTNVLGQAANGSTDAAAKFQRLGLNVDELLAQSPEEQFRSIMRGVAAIENPTLRAAAAMGIFGDAGSQLGPMINGGADALDAYIQEAKDAGVVMSKDAATSAANLSDAIGRLQSSTKGMSLSVASALVPAAQIAVDWFSSGARSVRTFADENPKLVKTITSVGAALAAVLGGLYIKTRLADYTAGFVKIFRTITTGNGVLGKASQLFSALFDAATTSFRGIETSGARTFDLLVKMGTRSFGATTQIAANVLQLSNAQASAFAKNLAAEKFAAFQKAATSAFSAFLGNLKAATSATKAFSLASSAAAAKEAILRAATVAAAAAKNLLTSATVKATGATIAQTAKTVLATAATTAAGVATKGLAAAMLAVSATPIGAVVAVSVGVLGALTYAATSAAEEVANLTNEYEKFVEKADKKRGLDAMKFEFLTNAGSSGPISDVDFETGKRYVDELQGSYGDLGIVVADAAKTITLAADAQERFNAAVREKSALDVAAQIREEEANLKELEKVRNSYYERAGKLGGFNLETTGAVFREAGAWASFGYLDAAEEAWGKSIADATKNVDDQQTKLAELRDRFDRIRGGSTDAALGKSKEEETQNKALELANQASEALDPEKGKALDDSLNAFLESAADADLSPLERTVAEIEKRGAAMKTAIWAAIDPKGLVDRTDATAVQTFKAANADAAKYVDKLAEIDAATAKNVERARLADATATSDKLKALRDQIAAAEDAASRAERTRLESRADEIDRETAAYKNLLTEALKLAATEEERAEIQAKLDGAAAKNAAKKSDLYAEAAAKAPDANALEVIKTRKELGELLSNAALGKIGDGDAEKIAALKTKLSTAENAAATERLADAQQALTAAVEELSEARKSNDTKSIAEAVDRLATSQTEYDAAFSAVESVASNLENATDSTDFSAGIERGVTNAENSLAATGTFSAFAAASLANGYDRKLYDQSREQTRLLENIARKTGVAVFA